MHIFNALRVQKKTVQLCVLFTFAIWATITPLTSNSSEENKVMNKVNVYIIHGFMASPTDHWFQWLKEKLEERGISVKVLALPDSSAPNPIVWQQTLSDNIDSINESTFIVAHSLGCISVLNYMEDSEVKSIGGLILVSGFVAHLPALPQLDSFVDKEVNFEKVIKAAPQRAVIGSPEDSIVPYSLTEALASDLSADLYSIHDAGHFLAEDGYDSFPQLLDTLLKMTYR
jgi:hypothetical protein